ncbi:MAG: hypothetical protein BWY92_01643 [Firmicutes bacterium ADurb.BinA052]|nr:MAG: hypothetical protein BWY92_01643 [Firmicutes bacterium ADurb.BinA052]
MTGGTGGKLTSPAYRLKSQAAKPASTCACKFLMRSPVGSEIASA